MIPSARAVEAEARVDAITQWVARHWLAMVNVAWGALVTLPWLAPVAMRAGWQRLASGIYFFYSFLCHQYANRSFFLFGEKVMYSYTELLPYASNVDTWQGLRAFRGTPELGYKVAWSDRMVWLYGSIFVAGVVFALLRPRVRPLPVKVFLLLLVPLALDGGTHVISDWFGVGQGFRYTNEWLAALTGYALPAQFYVGNAPGSFNFWVRFLTGVLSGVAVVWVAYPRVEHALAWARVPARSTRSST